MPALFSSLLEFSELFVEVPEPAIPPFKHHPNTQGVTRYGINLSQDVKSRQPGRIPAWKFAPHE